MAKEKANTLLTIYGCKLSKDSKRLVLTLVTGEDEDKQYYSACVKLDGTQKTKASISKDKKYGLLKVEMLKEDKKQNKKQKKEDVEVDINEDEIPF